MGSVPSELSFDSMTVSSKTMRNILQSSQAPVEKSGSLLSELQAEVKKIGSVQNQLPLSMLLLNDAIVAVKEWIDSSDSKKKQQKQAPVLEEFIPLKKSCGDDEEIKECRVKDEIKDSSKDKRSWMSSVQLWSSDDSLAAKQIPRLESKENKKGNGFGNEDALSRKLKIEEENGGRDEDLGVPDLSLLTPGMKNVTEEFVATSSSRGVSQCDSQSDLRVVPHHHLPINGSRKQRRCWSAELHRRFVNALQQLGGSQAATPKQIREIMQVDGLTNDEVKSHLQKYRLHTRRTGIPPANQPLVVLGGLWMSPQECSKAASSQSNSPQGPLQFTGGDSMEDDNEDDAKSENYSWRKCHTQRPGRVGV
ncbi:Myb family transcription factor EFM [Linum grandiflorum]